MGKQDNSTGDKEGDPFSDSDTDMAELDVDAVVSANSEQACFYSQTHASKISSTKSSERQRPSLCVFLKRGVVEKSSNHFESV